MESALFCSKTKKQPKRLSITLMEAAPRFELGVRELQSRALPLGYAAIMERKTGFEPATLALARRCSTTEPLSHIYYRFETLMVPKGGIEPPTRGFSVLCSTD